MQIIDLFAGVGGMSLGFSMAGFEPVLAVEYDVSIANAYKKNHSTAETIADDIKILDIENTFKKYQNKVTGVIGGPPCQGFSQKGKRLSINDERNFMFKYFIKVVEYVKPQFFVLENVPNIITTLDGFFKDEIIDAFKEIGYDVDAKILNAYDYGVPQQRKRAFFIGQKNKLTIEFPKEKDFKVSVKEAIYDLPFIDSGERVDFYNYEKKPQNDYQQLLRKNTKGIYNHQATNHSKVALERLALIPKGKGREVLPKEHRTKSIYSGTWSRLIEDKPAATITTRFDTPSSGLFTHPILDRCLTVREAARIQSFPDSFIFHGTKTSQMKQVGNAVPPLLAYAIAKNIKKSIK
jgi:DNA (cytosine-5)-methyltransferase 1